MFSLLRLQTGRDTWLTKHEDKKTLRGRMLSLQKKVVSYWKKKDTQRENKRET